MTVITTNNSCILFLRQPYNVKALRASVRHHRTHGGQAHLRNIRQPAGALSWRVSWAMIAAAALLFFYQRSAFLPVLFASMFLLLLFLSWWWEKSDSISNEHDTNHHVVQEQFTLREASGSWFCSQWRKNLLRNFSSFKQEKRK